MRLPPCPRMKRRLRVLMRSIYFDTRSGTAVADLLLTPTADFHPDDLPPWAQAPDLDFDLHLHLNGLDGRSTALGCLRCSSSDNASARDDARNRRPLPVLKAIHCENAEGRTIGLEIEESRQKTIVLQQLDAVRHPLGVLM